MGFGPLCTRKARSPWHIPYLIRSTAVLRLGAHATAIGLYDWFLSATLGLRYNL